MNDLIRAKGKGIDNLQDIIKTDNLCYKSKNRKVYNFSEYYLPVVFLTDIHEGNLSLKDVGDEQFCC